MEVKMVKREDRRWEFILESEDHTFANLLRELCWNFGGEAAYRVEHPLLARPKVKVVAEKPQELLLKVTGEIKKLAQGVEKAFR